VLVDEGAFQERVEGVGVEVFNARGAEVRRRRLDGGPRVARRPATRGQQQGERDNQAEASVPSHGASGVGAARAPQQDQLPSVVRRRVRSATRAESCAYEEGRVVTKRWRRVQGSFPAGTQDQLMFQECGERCDSTLFKPISPTAQVVAQFSTVSLLPDGRSLP